MLPISGKRGQIGIPTPFGRKKQTSQQQQNIKKEIIKIEIDEKKILGEEKIEQQDLEQLESEFKKLLDYFTGQKRDIIEEVKEFNKLEESLRKLLDDLAKNNFNNLNNHEKYFEKIANNILKEDEQIIRRVEIALKLIDTIYTELKKLKQAEEELLKVENMQISDIKKLIDAVITEIDNTLGKQTQYAQQLNRIRGHLKNIQQRLGSQVQRAQP